ncbi:MAG TPA: homoserine kinase [Acidobacteriaceae bacterium]|jgi:homoserine kinase|nr:homoserine kinase [Acidobacteriaceae bacterium]
MRGVRVRLPATSANLGPGFDAAGLALTMHLTVEAHVAPVWQVEATGRDAEVCGRVERNLLIETYKDVLAEAGVDAPALRLVVRNEIPLGMGCGSSAAALCAGVALAEHFGELGWSAERMIEEASRREGHPDNVAACWWGGFTASAEVNGRVEAATFAGNPAWQMLLVMQTESLATTEARALLPESYARADAVFNVQRVALLTAAFAQGRLDLLRTAMEDRLHQPYRAAACPLLAKLLPLMKEPEIAGVALSGAGPSVLVVLAEQTTLLEAETRIAGMVGEGVEVVPVRIAEGVEKTVL